MVENTLKLKVDRLLFHQNLPNCKLTDHRRTRGQDKELWLVEDDSTFIDSASIVERVLVWLCDLPEPANYEFHIREILYQFNNRWKYRDIAKRHRLPCENIVIHQPSKLMPIFKVFLDLYLDDFGTYRNTYHSLGGVYLQFGNMPLSHRKQLKNHFLIGFVPFGAKFSDFIKPILEDIRQLENGFVMQINGEDAWIIGGLGCVTADLPQGNDLAGIKQHNATHGCRTCNASSEQLTNAKFDHIANARYCQHTNQLFKELDQQKSTISRTQFATRHGLAVPSPLDNLIWNQHIQTPQDAYHSMAGKARTLMDITFNLLNQSGEKEWNIHWRHIEKPTRWNRMPNPLTHRQSFTFNNILQLYMLMPIIFRRFLKPSHLKTTALQDLYTTMKTKRNGAIISCLCQLWTIEAKALKCAFATSMTNDDYKNLDLILCKERELLLQVSNY